MFYKVLLVSLMLTYSTSACPITKFVNTTKHPCNKFDISIYKYAKKRCVQLYLDSPCVKLFKKCDKRDYSVVCGEA